MQPNYRRNIWVNLKNKINVSEHLHRKRRPLWVYINGVVNALIFQNGDQLVAAKMSRYSLDYLETGHLRSKGRRTPSSYML